MFWRVKVRYHQVSHHTDATIRLDAATYHEALERVKETHRHAQILSYQPEGGQEHVYCDPQFKSTPDAIAV